MEIGKLTADAFAVPRRYRPDTGAGLFFTLVTPLLSYLLFQGLYGSAQSPTRIAVGICAHWINFFVVLLIVITAEREPLSSIGVRPLRWSTIPLGLAAGVLFTVVTGAVTTLL